MQTGPQPVVPPSQQVEYLRKEDLVLGVNVKVATVARNILSSVISPVEAEVSLSPTIIIPLITNDRGNYRVRTLLDSGSGTNWIVASILKNIAFTVKGSEVLEVATFSGVMRKKYPLVEVLYPLPNGKTANLMCYANSDFTRHIAAKGMVGHIKKNSKIEERILSELADPASQEIDHGKLSQGIGLILCSSSINKIRIQENMITLHKIDILLEPTIFGVAISGAIPAYLRSPDNIIMANNIAPSLVSGHQDPRLFLTRDDVTLPEDVSFMWEQENLGIQPEEQHEDHKLAWESFINNIVRDETSGQYTVGLPWNNKKYLLRDNRAVAAARSYGQREIMVRDPEYLKLMLQAKKDLEDKDYIEEIDTDFSTDNIVYYMPYRGIIKKESETTKCRLVMDASSKPSASHISLNQALYQGPNLIVELAILLLRFMLGKFASVSDIEKAFLRILIAPCDRDALRFFWFNDPLDSQEKPKTYRFKAVMFGSAASPFQLAAVLQTLIKNDCRNAKVRKGLEEGIYVDNIMYATNSEEELVEFFKVSREVLASGSFNLRQWASNSPKLMDKATKLEVVDLNPVVKVLGLFWDIGKDMFLFNSSLEWDKKFTKRSALSFTNKVFDPLGWLTPMNVRRRLFIQKLWAKEMKWNDSFEFVDNLAEEWLHIVQETHIAITSSKGRLAAFTSNSELHIFSDASAEAYGAIVYVRTPGEIGQPAQVQMVSAKAKITKKGNGTIPRWELAGVVIAGHLVSYIRKAWDLPRDMSINLWCDARVVLNWLSQYDIKETYVHNRVAQVRKLCEPAQFTTTLRYVPTHMNPADILTRVNKAENFKKDEIWWNGPSWLLDEEEWPDYHAGYNLYPVSWKRTPILQTAVSVGDTSVLKFFKERKFNSGLKTLAYVLRAFNTERVREGDYRKHSPPTEWYQNLEVGKSELDHAKVIATKLMQGEMFAVELATLVDGREIKVGPCKGKSVFLDSKGIMRAHGRLERHLEPDITNDQILAHGYHPFVQSYIRHKHRHFNCSSKQYTLHIVRQELIGPSLTVSINQIVRECFACRVLRARPYSYPKQPPLPRERVTAERPFAVCGVDYSGPYLVRQGRASLKVWIALFTCMVSRAIHLELVADLKADTFIEALQSMSWKKGTPKVILSDNATNFTKAAKILKEFSLDRGVNGYLANESIEWKFTPAYAPHFGAVYERMIGVLKKELQKLLGLAQSTYHELATQLAEIEGIINNRPLIQVGAREVISPMNILTGSKINNEQILNVLDTDQILKEAMEIRKDLPQLYHTIAKRKATFWHNFQHQYLESLKFSKDVTKNKGSIGPEVGDVVIIHSKDPRLQWRKAIVLEKYPSEDGEIRKCRIKTSTGESIRAVRDLYPLEMNVEEYKDQDQYYMRLDYLEKAKEYYNKTGDKQEPKFNDFEGFETSKPPDRAQMALELLNSSIKERKETERSANLSLDN